MRFFCQHCDAPAEGAAYRVKSEESGVVLLHLIVCQACSLEARKLGLHTEAIGADLSGSQARPVEIH
jgi:hypothetical protein